MIYNTPHYYSKFTCIADKCIDNCCFGGWQIDIDEETMNKYRQLDGNFGARLRSNIDTKNNCFKLTEGQCPFLSDNNLCEIYKTLGEDYMGVVCAQFPRFTEYYGDIKETGLGLACEEAAKIILNDSIAFSLSTSETDDKAFWGEYDKNLGKPFFTLRGKLMQMIDEEADLGVSSILYVILNAFNTLQPMINSNDYRAVEEYCASFNASAAANMLPYSFADAVPVNAEAAKNEDLFEICKSIWYSYLDLEPINSYWENLSNAAFECIYEKNVVYFPKFSDKFLEIKYKKLIQYYLYRYMMKAAFDHDIVGKIKLIIANLVVMSDLYCYKTVLSASDEADAAAHLCQKPAKYDDSTFMDIIHIFSRQTEYSDDNILELYDSFIFDDAYSYESLSSFLLMQICP